LNRAKASTELCKVCAIRFDSSGTEDEDFNRPTGVAVDGACLSLESGGYYKSVNTVTINNVLVAKTRRINPLDIFIHRDSICYRKHV